MAWTIKFDVRADKEFDRLDASVRRDIDRYLLRLAGLDDPRVRGKSLSGTKQGLWRYRVGKYRLLYSIHDQHIIILVVQIGKRDKVYDD